MGMHREIIMNEKYTQLRDITLEDILGLKDGPFKQECLNRLAECGFIKKEEPKWKEISMRDLHRIRDGVTLKRIVNRRETLIHVTSDPYWSSWSGSMPHVLVCVVKRDSGHGSVMNGVNEYSINDLFNGEVYILQE